MENDYIVITPDVRDTFGLVTLTWKDLYTADFSFNMPFCLTLENNENFLCEKVVRIIPKKRMVVFGIWREKEVVAKLFLDNSKLAKINIDRDIEGIQTLQKNKVPTPDLLHITTSKDSRIQILILERIIDSKSLDEIWRQRKYGDDRTLSIFKKVVVEIATQHVVGLLQHDLHLKNFLFNEKNIYTLDGAQIESFPELLSKNVSMDNLALFLSQLGIEVENYQEILFRHYAEARGWTLKPEDFANLFFLINKWNETRWKKFEKKIIRNCSQFEVFKYWFFQCVYDRKYAGPELFNFLNFPDAAFDITKSKILKSGNSSTVIKIKLDNKDYVVKRYNIKNHWHRLRRSFRPTRARNSWRIAQKLHLFGIAIAKPVAFVEQSFLGVPGRSYYVTEYVSDENAADYFNKHISDTNKTEIMVKRISSLLQSMAKIEITHGDLKITNLLIDKHENPVLIDLDGVDEYVSLFGLRKAWEKELARFLQNFDGNPTIRKQFEAEFERW